MAISRNTNTILDGSEVSNGQTRTGLSTQIVVLVNGNPVGAIQSFGGTQQRTTRPVMEVGTDGVIEIVPSGATTISLSIQRIVFDGLSLPEAFSRGFMNIAAQRIPFDIVVIDRFGGTSATDAYADSIVTTYKNCWFTNLSKTYSSSDYIVSESASVSCETVFSTKNNAPIGGTGVGFSDDPRTAGVQTDQAGIEQSVDSGEARGSMSTFDIINSTF